MTLIVPPVAPPPYWTAPLPRTISMRSIESIGMPESCADSSSFSLMRMPSSSTSVFWSPVTPKPRRSSCGFCVPARSRICSRPNCARMSPRLDDALERISSALMTVTPTGRSRLLSGKRVAVTTTASSCAKANETARPASRLEKRRSMETSLASSPTPPVVEEGSRPVSGLARHLVPAFRLARRGPALGRLSRLPLRGQSRLCTSFPSTW